MEKFAVVENGKVVARFFRKIGALQMMTILKAEGRQVEIVKI